MSTSVQQAVTPMLFFEAMGGYQRTAVLVAAMELDVFTRLAEGKSANERTAAAVAHKLGASEKGVRILCDFLTVSGFLEKKISTNPGHSYELTADSAAFLDRRSPASLAKAPEFLAPPQLKELAAGVVAAVRKGGTTTEQPTNELDPRWVDFARGMAPFTGVSAGPLAEAVHREGPQKVLDIAASHGMFGIACLKRNPQARVVAVDGAAVLEVGEENARNAGVSERWSKLAGDAFRVDFGTGYDAALVTNFLHHFEPEVNERFLRKVHGSLKPGGKVAVLEFVPNEDRVSPPIPAAFAMNMLIHTEKGDAFTFRELSAMLENAGYCEVQRHDLPTPQTIVVAQRA